MNRITDDGSLTRPDGRLVEDCYRVLLPVVGDLHSSGWLEQLLRAGTRAVLLGETRAEYVAREMSSDRRTTETAEQIKDLVGVLVGHADDDLLVAIDQEPWGIRRLHDLVPPYPDAAAIAQLSPAEIRENAREVAKAAKACGISMFLSPVLDVLTGENPWLEGRTLSLAASHAAVGSIGAAYVAGTQASGVATVAKHFPGFPSLAKDPALHADTAVPVGQWDERALEPFDAVVRAGVAAVMIGPAIVEGIDKGEPASTSDTVVNLLRDRVGFPGLVVSDDLDAPATLNGRTLTATMIDSLRAGADLLLVGGGEHLQSAVEAIYETARDDDSFASRVQEAAARVTATARSFAACPSE